MVEFGFVRRQPLALRAELGFKPRQLRLRDQRLDAVPAGPTVARAEAEHLPAPTRHRGSDAAGRARRADDGELVHWLEEVRLRRGERLLHRDPSSEAEGKLGTVHTVIATVDK